MVGAPAGSVGRPLAAVLTSVVAAALIAAGAVAMPASDWWSNDLRPSATAEISNYLEVHEHFFTDFVRLSGKWTVMEPGYCSGDYSDPPSCDGADTPSITVHLFHGGREVYSDEVFAFGSFGSADTYADGRFVIRLYWVEIPGFDCARRSGLGLYSWRVTMADPYERRGFETNVRHLNAIRLFCRSQQSSACGRLFAVAEQLDDQPMFDKPEQWLGRSDNPLVTPDPDPFSEIELALVDKSTGRDHLLCSAHLVPIFDHGCNDTHRSEMASPPAEQAQ